ncbi:MAG: 4Fe-4S binding protein [Lawsonibacter sp.]|nr:4Fe-4S binding protein [Lawsonibacter sp.]
MIGVYFSGTGGTKYCVETFIRAYSPAGEAVSIEEADAAERISGHAGLVVGYPVQFSSVPKIVRDFVADHPELWRGRHIFVIASMGLFSGDGAGVLARLLAGYGAEIIGGLHVKMPDSICDERVLKRTPAQNRALVARAAEKIERAAQDLKERRPPQEGLSPWNRLAGLLGQRLYFGGRTKKYSSRLKIDGSRCVRCGTCVRVCPMKNISMGEDRAVPGGRCTMCYRCVSLCPAQAVTLLGRRVYRQCRIETLQP